MARDYEKLAEKARRLTAMAEDPHPGLFSWCEAFDRAEKALYLELLGTRAPDKPAAVVAPHDDGKFYFDIVDASGTVARVVVSSWRNEPKTAEAIAQRLAAIYAEKT